jgi:prophage antirepressor-like protein
MRQRDKELPKGWVQIVPTLWVETAGGKQRMGCTNAKGLLRIIQSIPSPKAEPFKLWLAQQIFPNTETIAEGQEFPVEEVIRY